MGIRMSDPFGPEYWTFATVVIVAIVILAIIGIYFWYKLEKKKLEVK